MHSANPTMDSVTLPTLQASCSQITTKHGSRCNTISILRLPPTVLLLQGVVLQGEEDRQQRNQSMLKID
jgi:hypothetical protein